MNVYWHNREEKRRGHPEVKLLHYPGEKRKSTRDTGCFFIKPHPVNLYRKNADNRL